jgi:S1-C subfamily serine protease
MIKGIGRGILMRSILIIFIVWSLIIIVQGNLRNPYSIKNSLVSVTYENGHGTGFVVASDGTGSYIITNKHVCRDGSAGRIGNGRIRDFYVISWTFYDRPTTSAEFIKTDAGHDLCLLKISIKNLPRAKISKNEPYTGQRVQSVGNPGSKLGYYISGYVGGLSELWFGEYAVQFSADVLPGASGSPVYNSKEEVVGIACGGAFGKSDSVFVNGKYLKDFLGEIYGQN